MNFLILHSLEDIASMNIYERTLNSNQYTFKDTSTTIQDHQIVELMGMKQDLIKGNHIYLGLIDDPLIFLKRLIFSDREFKPDLLIFASRHRSKTARPAFLVHSTGNWTADVEFGGEPFHLSKTSALMLKAGFTTLNECFQNSSLTNFAVDLEVTHHGPTALTIPLIFMELGSTEQEWSIKVAGKLVSDAIITAIFKYIKYKENNEQQIGIGFGGTHYSPNFNRLISNNNIAISFICPKYFILNLNENMITQMLNHTFEKVDYFIIDWKGTNSEDKKHLIPLLETFNIPIKKTKDFKTN